VRVSISFSTSFSPRPITVLDLIKMNKLVFLFFCALVCAVLCTRTGVDSPSCSFLKDIVPHPILQCANNIPINCTGSTVCYKYTDSIFSAPCALAEIGMKRLLNSVKCSYGIGFSVQPGLVICTSEKFIRQFYACFNNTA